MELMNGGANSKDGFSLSRSVFNNFDFVQGLRELAKLPLDIKVSWNINRIIRQAQKHIDDGQSRVKALLDKHVEKDEAGKMVQDGGDFKFKDRAAFEAEYNAYGEEEVHFKSYKIDVNDLQGAKISAELLNAIEPVIVGLE